MIDHAPQPTARLERETGFRFRIRFDGPRTRDVVTDEPPPLGGGVGPGPSALLGAAIANCLASSLTFCLEKARLPLEGLEAEAWVETTRNDDGRLRIPKVRVVLSPEVSRETRARMSRCVEIFESFCTVTESIRRGIEVQVDVEPRLVGETPGAREQRDAASVERESSAPRAGVTPARGA